MPTKRPVVRKKKVNKQGPRTNWRCDSRNENGHRCHFVSHFEKHYDREGNLLGHSAFGKTW